MKYHSLNSKENSNHNGVSFQEALRKGLAPDKGLYFPEEIEKLPSTFFENITDLSDEEIAFTVIRPYIGKEIPEPELRKIISETLCFEFPLVKLDAQTWALELFHGPTMAFKDVGARFMARCLGYFNTLRKSEKTKVLVATSGDTGGAVAGGFLGVPGVQVIILYPSGKVSEIQEKQLTTLGRNIVALEVDGVFDDCQDMVKTAFLDHELDHLNLTSANSINVARWLPQMFYFFIAYKQLKSLNKPINFAVPSGNFGNICAGIVAFKMGLPVNHFIAATNSNDTVPQFMKTGEYRPKPSKSTISNAMDVGNPSNFIRIQRLFDNDIEKLKERFSSASYDDNRTKETMKAIYDHTGYIADPHGAVGYLGLKEYGETKPDEIGVFLETAHPVKFKDIVEKTLHLTLEIPPQIQSVMEGEKISHPVQDYQELKDFLLAT